MDNSAAGMTHSHWEFLETLFIFGEPVAIDAMPEITGLSPGTLIKTVRLLTKQGLVSLSEGEQLSLSSDIPAEISDKIQKMHTFGFARELLARSSAKKDLPAGIRANILIHAGRSYDACILLHERATQCTRAGRVYDAMDDLYKVLEILREQRGYPGSDSLFITVALDLSQLVYRMGIGFGKIPDLLREVQEKAKDLGNQRILAIVNLHIGRFFYLSERLSDALTSLWFGLDMAATIGDEDILDQAAEFHGLYYYLQGKYLDAVIYFERAIKTAISPDNILLKPFLPTYMSYAYTFLGQFNRAIGILESHHRRAKLNGEENIATLFRASLSLILMLAGRKKEGLKEMRTAQEEAKEQGNERAVYFLKRTMGARYFFEGRLRESYEMYKDVVAGATLDNSFTRQHIWPFALETLYAFERSGFEPIPNFNFNEVMDMVLAGPNIHLRGVAWRIRAKQATEIPQAEQLLLASIADLELSGDQTELAKSRIELARIYLRRGDRKSATCLAFKAWEILSQNGEYALPDELKGLVQVESISVERNQREELLSRFMELSDQIVPSADKNALLVRITDITSHFFSAERAALFFLSENRKRPHPVLAAGYNLTGHEVNAESFRSNLAKIIEAFKNGQPLLTKPFRPHYCADVKTQNSLILPIVMKDGTSGILFFENTYPPDILDLCDRTFLMRIARHVSAHIDHVTEYCRLIQEASINASIQSVREVFGEEIVFLSKAMNDLIARLDMIAGTDATALLLGETGVGKELFARRLHEMSLRSSNPFIVVDLASIPENLVESELFGHEKGAFTGAESRKTGRIELAHKGTLFLDEIGEISKSTQVKLLRALQEKSFVRVGGVSTIYSDFRLVAATNRDLEQEVSAGNFREDLYYRISVVPLKILPLRKRGEDIILLAKHFLDKFASRYHRPGLALTQEDKAKIAAYHWPGNVRELKNVMERAVILSQEGALDLSLPGEKGGTSQHLFLNKPSLEELERQYIRFILTETGNRIGGPGGAAEILGLKRSTLYARMKKLGID